MKPIVEWLLQSDYDISVADALFQSRKYIYAVFMCHLAVEKALKALFTKQKLQMLPKSHNLIYFAMQLENKIPDDLYNNVYLLNDASIATRYPEKLQAMQKEFPEAVTADIIKKSKDVILWIKQELEK